MNWENKFDELVEAYGWEGDLAEDGKDKFIKSFIKDLLSQHYKKIENYFNRQGDFLIKSPFDHETMIEVFDKKDILEFLKTL